MATFQFINYFLLTFLVFQSCILAVMLTNYAAFVQAGTKTFKSESIFRLKHYHGISPENNHPDVIFVSCLGKFGGFVQNEIHEWVKATQNAFYRPASIDLQLDLKYEKISCKNILKCYTSL